MFLLAGQRVDSSQHVSDTPIVPEYAEWKIGKDNIQIEHLRIASIGQVSQGSWQAELFCNRPTQTVVLPTT